MGDSPLLFIPPKLIPLRGKRTSPRGRQIPDYFAIRTFSGPSLMDVVPATSIRPTARFAYSASLIPLRLFRFAEHATRFPAHPPAAYSASRKTQRPSWPGNSPVLRTPGSMTPREITRPLPDGCGPCHIHQAPPCLFRFAEHAFPRVRNSPVLRTLEIAH